MLEKSNLFFQPIRQFQPPQHEIEQLNEVFNNAKAIRFYITRTISKCFQIITPVQQQRQFLLLCYFRRLQEGVNSQKTQKITNLLKVKAIRILQQNQKKRQKKRKRQLSIEQKLQNIKNKLIFNEWRAIVRTQKSSNSLIKLRKSEIFREFAQFLKQNRQSHLLNSLQINTMLLNSQDSHSKKLQKKSFQALILNKNSMKLARFLRTKSFKEFKRLAQYAAAEEDKIVLRFRKKLVNSKCFQSWKQIFQESLASKFRNDALTYRFFQQWKSNVIYFASERQIQQNNNCIAEIFQQRLQKKILQNTFKGWIKLTIELKESRYKNSVLNTFADKKCKHLLLTKYFQKLRLHCVNNKIQLQYYNNKLKRKSLDSLKLYFRDSVEREEKVIQFEEQRTIKKYFMKIKLFNKNEEEKVKKFQTKRLFKIFTQIIIANYCYNQQKAENYHRINLLYKVVFTLKKEQTFRKQEQYAIAHINFVLPLRRWLKTYRIRKFQQDRIWFMKKAIFREWKLNIILKASEKKAIRQFRTTSEKKPPINSQAKMQQHQFQNILATIAKIRNNLQAQKQTTAVHPNPNIRSLQLLGSSQKQQSIDFEYSLQNF